MSKVAGKYDPKAEAEVRTWIQQLTGEAINEHELYNRLKDGVILGKLIKKVYEGTPPDQLPPACRNVPLRFRNSDKPAVQMENIEIFLRAATAYGVPQPGLFACNDLYEGKNMPMVMSTILQVGSEAQRWKFDGPTCGTKPLPKKQKPKFTREQLRESHTILSSQSGTNKYASQKGMAFGAVRHCADIRADDINQDGQAELGLQSGTNKFASQKGMSFGAIRHISDIKSDDMVAESQGQVSLQSGTNKFASQKGMTFGSVRHCADIRADDALQESSGDIGLQMGSNKFASQKGMSFGAVRHIADIRADDMSQESSGYINLQSGWNKGASQSGMRGFGAARHVADIKVTELADELELVPGDEGYEEWLEYKAQMEAQQQAEAERQEN